MKMNLSLKTLYLILAMTLIFTAVPISAAHLEELQDQPVLSEQVVDTEVISIESTEEVKNPSVEIENVEDYVKSFVQSMSNEENNWNKKN